MYKHKKSKKKYGIIAAAVFVVLLICFGINVFRPNRNLNAVEKILKDSILFVQKTIGYPFHFIGEKIEESKDKNNLYKKYQELEKKVESVNLLEAEKEELQKQIDALKSTLDLNATLAEKKYLNATVIHRNVGYWYNTITVDKGSSSGVLKDMAVITKDGLIGKVVTVSNFSSTIKLLTSDDTNNKTSVKIKIGETYVYGLLVGYDQKNGTYKIEGIAENTTIPEGSLVTTTGMGDIYPSGIIIGTVSGVTTDNFDLAKIVQVKSNVQIDAIDYVTILERKAAVE